MGKCNSRALIGLAIMVFGSCSRDKVTVHVCSKLKTSYKQGGEEFAIFSALF